MHGDGFITLPQTNKADRLPRERDTVIEQGLLSDEHLYARALSSPVDGSCSFFPLSVIYNIGHQKQQALRIRRLAPGLRWLQ